MELKENTIHIYDSQFERMAEQSGYWHSKSCHLMQSSKILWDAWSQGDSFDSGDTYRMLMGLSFELLFKSFLVAKEIEVEATHNLNKLASLAGFEPDEKESHIFTNLTGYIYWQGKYPIPKPIKTSKKQVTGGDGIKKQLEPFIDSYADDQNIFKDQPKVPATLTSDDLDYDNLLLLWKKYNNIYVGKYITT